MFAMHVSNPFTSNSRREERDRKIMVCHPTWTLHSSVNLVRKHIARNVSSEMLPARLPGSRMLAKTISEEGSRAPVQVLVDPRWPIAPNTNSKRTVKMTSKFSIDDI